MFNLRLRQKLTKQKRLQNMRGLTDAQMELVDRFIVLLRDADQASDARTGAQRFFCELRERVPTISDADAACMADDAVAFARSRL